MFKHGCFGMKHSVSFIQQWLILILHVSRTEYLILLATEDVEHHAPKGNVD